MAGMNKQTTEFTLPVIIPPGEHIQEMLDERGMSQTELARRMKRPTQVINEIVNGKKAITAETALQLEGALGVSAQTWMNLESSYRLALARKTMTREDIEVEVFRAFVAHFKDATDQWLALKGFLDEITHYGPPQPIIASTRAKITDADFKEILAASDEMIDRFQKITDVELIA